MSTRIFDFIFSLIGLIISSPIFVSLFILGYLDSGSPIFVQERVGRFKRPFKLFKFRSMHLNTKTVPTHLANSNSITKYGKFLRKSKLDELPQLWNVLKGEMSLVGPRPNLFSQIQLIKERDRLNVYDVRPGITGLAQINKIDMSDPDLLAKFDSEMINAYTIYNYFKILLQTISGNGFGDRIK